ncbi:MAG: urease accessory protein UreF [Acidimicrobiia bacterium]
MLPLLLADGRFPSGGHAHSGGVEAAVDAGRVHDGPSLRAFLDGRLATAGRVAAALAAAAATGRHDVDRLEREASARISSPALRDASLAQGRLLLRAAAAILSAGDLPVGDHHHAVAVGLVARAAGQTPREAARWAAYDAVAGPAGAAVRLCGLDPFETWAAVAALAVAVEEVAAEAAARASDDDLCSLPACSAPLLDVGAEHHIRSEVRLFVS